MRLGLLAGPGSDWRDGVEKVRVAEELGVEFVSTGEAWGKSVIPWLAALATQTSKVTLGTSILNVYSRTPGAMAQDYAMLEELSDGRMVLGLGSSGEFVIEHFHGVPFRQPLRRIREYVEVFNMLIAGERLEYEGEIFQMSRGFRLEYDRTRDHIPVYIAAITPKSIHQTGQIADGIYPIHWPRELFGQLRADMEAGAAEAGDPGRQFTIAPFTRVGILDGTDADEAQWAEGRRLLHHYVNRMGVFYWQMLARNGFEAEVEASKAAWAERDTEASVAAISDDMVRSCQVIGSIDEVREQLHQRSELGADVQMLYMPEGTPADVGHWLESLMA